MSRINLLGSYRNGNYNVSIYEDGTKIRETNDDEFIPSRLESFDCKITEFCDMGCPQCHEMSTIKGKHGDLRNPVLMTLPQYTEIAIGGGNPLSHPDLDYFLKFLKKKRCIPNMTVNQMHFMKEVDRLRNYRDKHLIYGLGISLVDVNKEFIDKVIDFPNAVIHVIAGIVTLDQLREMSKLGVKKVLILGYKQFGRGKDYYNENIQKNIEILKENMQEVKKMFKVLSFDNLAIKQLDIKSLLTEEEWSKFYMGDDGTYTMYIDLVKNKYAQSSTSEERFNLLENINEMFLDIREKKVKANDN